MIFDFRAANDDLTQATKAVASAQTRERFARKAMEAKVKQLQRVVRKKVPGFRGIQQILRSERALHNAEIVDKDAEIAALRAQLMQRDAMVELATLTARCDKMFEALCAEKS